MDTPEFSVPEKRKKASTKKMLASALMFTELVKNKRLSDKVTIMPISTTKKAYVKIFGNSKAVSRLIEFMTDIGLISVANSKYRFNCKNAGKNLSRTYYYFYNNECALKEYCDTHNITVSHPASGTASLFDRLGIGDIDEEKVRINSKLRLKKPVDFSVTEFEDLLKISLYRRYPQLELTQQMFASLNDTYYADHPELQISFEPSFTWNKKKTMVTKIGIRATNGYCNAKKDKTDNPNFHGYYKQDVLDKYSLVYEKDVKSSVPRLTASINIGKWVPEQEDIYARIYRSYLRLKYPEGVPEDAVPFNDARPAIKSLHMRCYFDYEGRIGPNTRRAMSSVQDKDAVDAEIKLLR